MIFKGQLAAISLATLTAFLIMLIMLLSSGCVSTKGIEEISFGIPLVLMMELEYNDEADTSLNIGLPLGFDGLPLLAPANEEVVPVE
jgi:hypothetical protein